MRVYSFLGVASVLTCASLALAADEPAKTKTVSTSGIQFQVPESWKATQPTSSMRKSQLQIGPAEGDKEPAEMVLYVFPGGAGTAQANITRWQNQFKTSDGKLPDVETTKVKGQNAEVTRVECAGIYTDPFAKTGPQPHYRLLGAIVQTDNAGYFFKLIGPDQTVKAAEPGFDAMLKSIKTGG